MSLMDLPELQNKKGKNVAIDQLRENIFDLSKSFKTSWVNLAQSLYTVWEDKLYRVWGFVRFEDYTQKELGLRKQISYKLVKTYTFVENEEPNYLKEDFVDDRDPSKVPSYEEMNLLRLAKSKKELQKMDYDKIRNAIFEKGKDVAAVRKDLTAIIKERKVVDPEEERDKRNMGTLRRTIQALKVFKRDMESLKLVPQETIDEVEVLIERLQSHLP